MLRTCRLSECDIRRVSSRYCDTGVRNQFVLGRKLDTGGEAATLALQQPYTDYHIVYHIKVDEEEMGLMAN